MTVKDRQSVIERLQAWNDRIDAILKFYDPRGMVRIESLEKVRRLYRSLKSDLRAEYKAGAAGRGQAAMTETERRCYHPTIHEASVHLTAPTNAKSRAWFASLNDAQVDFRHMISQLKDAAEGGE